MQKKSILFTGDVMLGRLVDENLDHRSPGSVWGDLLPYFHKADLRIINLECALTKCEKTREKVFNFRSAPEHIKSLQEAKIDVCNVANNHVLDFDVEGLFDTLNVLDQKGIAHVGAGKNLVEAKKPEIIELEDLKIGIIGCSDNEPTWAAQENRPGIFYFSTKSADELLGLVDDVRPSVDLLFVSLHWGPNMQERPSGEFITFAHNLVDRGVDVLHGHSAHVFQPIECINGSVILYDTGDFIDDYAIDPLLRNDETFLYHLEVADKKLNKLSLLPAVITDCHVDRAKGKDFYEIVKQFRHRIAGFEDRFTVEDGGFFQAPHLELSLR